MQIAMPVPAHASAGARGESRDWGWVEVFILVLFLAPGLLLVPGAQSVRMIIRALPYVASLGILLLYVGSKSRLQLAPGGKLVALAMLLLAVNLFHPGTHPGAGVATWVFHLSIIAPLFWVSGAVRSVDHLQRVLWLILAVNALGALVGFLQVFYPQYFMPPALTSAIQDDVLSMMSWTNASGQVITRPPGLSDMPGGAALAGMIAGLLGMGLGLHPRMMLVKRLLCFGVALLGLATLYLTFVRSLLVMTLVAFIVLFILILKQGRVGTALGAIFASVGGVVAMFTVAGAIGGASLVDRFMGLAEVGLLESYQQNRGHFLAHTFDTLIYKYPLGAGVGRWGMMQTYFGNNAEYPPLWVEIQLTGWLLDGGILMWFLYGGALLVAVAYSLRIATSKRAHRLAYLAAIVLAAQLVTLGMAMSGPVFNSPLGIQFWLLTAALYGAVRSSEDRTLQV